MKSYLYICLTMLASFIFLASLGQTVINANKDAGTFPKPVRLKDTTIYKIITQTKDTFSFDTNKKLKIPQPDAITFNFLKANNKSLDILFHSDGTLLMTLNLEVTKQRIDTIGLYSPYDLTLIRFRIIKIYNCDIRSLQINNYNKVQQSAYHKKLLSKLLGLEKYD